MLRYDALKLLRSFGSLTQGKGELKILNRPFASSLVPLFQSESKCATILTKMTLICMKINLHAELIFK